MCLQIGFVIFWQKDFGPKAAHKMLVKFTPGANVIKLSLLTTRPNKLECLHPAKTFQSSIVVYHLLVAPGAYPRGKHLKGPPIGFAQALSSNAKTQMERVTKGKPSSLLSLVISNEGKKFYNMCT